MFIFVLTQKRTKKVKTAKIFLKFDSFRYRKWTPLPEKTRDRQTQWNKKTKAFHRAGSIFCL